jgi:7-keto-8-aminopelargonate synthetase-like enzyme
MAKIKHNNFIDTVDDVLSNASKEGALHLYAENNFLNGRTLRIKGQEMLHFGTTGYLGLEQDNRLKDASIQAIRNYGTQFPLSKSYISHPLYSELEHKIEQMYGIPPIITKNSTLGHLAIIPTLIRDEDAVIMDHQVHWSVQNACQLLKLRGIPVEMIRHNNINMLEDKIQQLASKTNKIWYMADGVYSMFGDYAPMEDLLYLSKRYPQLHLYFDDVHGMSWIGKNGTGFVLDSMKELNETTILVGTLSKTFGASGATLFCKDEKLRNKIKTFGGPLTFSAQLEPASVAAAIASADIHLSPEIALKQKDLADKIFYFNELLAQKNLPIISTNDSPVFFIGTGTPTTAYNFIQRLFKDGFYLNLGIYPAVPIKNTGIRITLSSHNHKEDIKALTEALDFHYLKSLEETHNSDYKIKRAFGLITSMPSHSVIKENSEILIEENSSIHAIKKEEWNQKMGKNSILDWDGLAFLEDAFAQNTDSTNKWDFYYYCVKDKQGNIILLTFFTYGLWKEDMIATTSVSKYLEAIRKKNPTYLTSATFSMGCLFTEGKHYYLDETHPKATTALQLLIEKVEEKYHELNADKLVYRDFETDNKWRSILQSQGYFKVDMPESCVIEKNDWHTYEEFSNKLSPRSKKHFNKEIVSFEQYYNVTIKQTLNQEELERAYYLYCNVKNNNLAINTFQYTFSVFEVMSTHQNWEFILLYNKEHPSNEFVGIMFCYKNNKSTYVPELIGMDYEWANKYHLYRQLLFQTIKRANSLSYQRIDFGVSATFEKRKLGATVVPKVAYIQSRDNYAMELIHTLQNEYKQ